MTAEQPTMRRTHHLTDEQSAAALALVADATDADGSAPLDENGRLGLRVDRATDADGRTHVLAEIDDGLAGYAHLDPAPEAEPSAELVVHPDRRGRGIGRALVAALVDAAGGGPVRVWSHGGLAAAAHLAAELGFAAIRQLAHMRAPLRRGYVVPPLPDGVQLRTFRPGEDDEAWLALNAAAFADHPEQGRWTGEDLRARLAEPWFDPAGFFLAEAADGRLLGFHWTKVDTAADGADDGRGEGEIYVLGVSPDAHGGGVGKALAVQGLAHLRERGLESVTLYVEADNVAALALYGRLGFTEDARHVMYRGPER